MDKFDLIVIGTGAGAHVVYLMNTEYQDLMSVIKSQVIHPTINEVLVRAFSELEHPINQSA